MRQYFWVMALMAINAWGAEIPTPSRMYIVSAAFSDFGALFYYRVVDVRTDGPDVVIRYSRIGWTNPGFCPRKIVQGAQVRLSNRTIKDLVKANNPCAVNPRDLAATVKKYSITAGHPAEPPGPHAPRAAGDATSGQMVASRCRHSRRWPAAVPRIYRLMLRVTVTSSIRSGVIGWRLNCASTPAPC